MITLSPMIPCGFEDFAEHNEESSSNEDLKLTNKIDPLRKDIAYLINELDNMIDEFPKTLTSWGFSVVNDPLN
ncbi:Hypothetical protein CINCED_3A010915 [Cinara cedri]|uniref:Uncharacterized protein n=1 Tax=Cinara cedri TaxID=506608 RepID=A0A5E4NKF5_9HEMI|nr:Hypothetical protein CINCED_3A010915 [Cinara cedri]